MADLARTARVDVLVEGYVRPPNVAGTVSLIRDEDRVVIVDPGMVADRELILRPLRELGVRPDDVTDVSSAITTSTTPSTSRSSPRSRSTTSSP